MLGRGGLDLVDALAEPAERLAPDGVDVGVLGPDPDGSAEAPPK
jgi:hypothetical protein